MLELRNGIRKNDKRSITHIDLHKPNNKLVHNLGTFGVRTSHEQIWTRKIHHGPDLGEATTFSLIIFFEPLHKGHIQMAFCLRTPKWHFVPGLPNGNPGIPNFGGPYFHMQTSDYDEV
jgi:hypothetical protein